MSAAAMHKKRSGGSSSSSSGPPPPPSSVAAAIPDPITDLRRAVRIEPSAASHTSSILSADAFSALHLDNTLTLASVQRDLHIDIIELTDDSMVFDLIGVDAAIANALRRILLAEVPTMAIEKVIIFQNTSIIQDEVLAHRLGLIPFKADPRQFKYLRESQHIPNEENTLVFTLDVHCTRRPGVPDTATPQEKYQESLITSDDLKWQPQASQAERFIRNPIEPTFDDIVIAKLRPGQSIECELHAEKGIGATHAKWSPVATASYRLLPEIRIVQPVLGEQAYELVSKCPMKVFDIEELSNDDDQQSHHTKPRPSSSSFSSLVHSSPEHVRAVVARPRNCSMCRECIRGAGWNERVELRRVKQHFIFSVETTGAYTPVTVVREAIHILKQKVNFIKQELLSQQQQQPQQQQPQQQQLSDQQPQSKPHQEEQVRQKQRKQRGNDRRILNRAGLVAVDENEENTDDEDVSR